MAQFRQAQSSQRRFQQNVIFAMTLNTEGNNVNIFERVSMCASDMKAPPLLFNDK